MSPFDHSILFRSRIRAGCIALVKGYQTSRRPKTLELSYIMVPSPGDPSRDVNG